MPTPARRAISSKLTFRPASGDSNTAYEYKLSSADAWTAVSETSDHGYPIREHLARLLDGDIIWAPAIDGALLLSARGGDYELRLGQDLSIGYLSHDAEHVELYFVESFTFAAYTTEASVVISA